MKPMGWRLAESWWLPPVLGGLAVGPVLAGLAAMGVEPTYATCAVVTVATIAAVDLVFRRVQSRN